MHLLRKIFRRVEVTLQYFLGKIRAVYQKRKYEIKRGYIHRTKSEHFDDTPLKDEYQKEVYELARFYLEKHHLTNVFDIGCGSAYKLLHFFHEYNTVGTDISPTYEFLVNTYPNRTWINAADTDKYPKATDLIICADVIEHLVNPDELLNLIGKIDFRFLFISTPERSMVRGWYDYGPPDNTCHVREWNAKEFKRYVGQYFQIIGHHITNVEDATQLLICTK